MALLEFAQRLLRMKEKKKEKKEEKGKRDRETERSEHFSTVKINQGPFFGPGLILDPPPVWVTHFFGLPLSLSASKKLMRLNPDAARALRGP